MAAVPSAAAFKISLPPPTAAAGLRLTQLRPPPKLTSHRPSSRPPTAEIFSIIECSDGSVIFRFADAEDLTEGKSIGSGEETESREPGYVEFGGKTNGAVESSNLASESEVLVQGLGIECGDSVVEMARLASDQENEKKVVISLNSSMSTVGWRVLHCLEAEKLERVGVFDGDHESKTEESELSEKRTDLEVESEIAQGMSVSIGIYEKHEQVKAKVSGSESALEVRQVCSEEEGSTLMLRGKN